VTAAETLARAHAELDAFGSATMFGATIAPDLTMTTIIALRDVLNRHAPGEEPFEIHRGPDCQSCGKPWPCPDAAAVLKPLGLPDEEDA
jgi:hypothetical protein